MRALLAELGVSGFVATLAIAALFVGAEFLKPGLGVNALSPAWLLVAAAVFLGFAAYGTVPAPSRFGSALYWIVGLVDTVAAAFAAWTVFAIVPDARGPLAAASAFAVGFLWFGIRPATP